MNVSPREQDGCTAPLRFAFPYFVVELGPKPQLRASDDDFMRTVEGHERVRDVVDLPEDFLGALPDGRPTVRLVETTRRNLLRLYLALFCIPSPALVIDLPAPAEAQTERLTDVLAELFIEHMLDNCT